MLNKWMDKENIAYTHHSYFLAIKKNQILAFSRKWIEEIYMLGKINQTQTVSPSPFSPPSPILCGGVWGVWK